MNSDRWGYFDGSGYHYWPAIVRAADHYGFDRNDPIYKHRHRDRRKGRKPCPSCGLHAATERNYPCDVQLARAADIESEGYPATFCSRCSIAMPVRTGQIVARCWYCENAPKSRRPQIRNGGAYVDDGLGCVEKLPSHVLSWEPS